MAKAQPARRVVVDLRGLGHTYPGAASPAVTGVDLTIAPGEFVALVGPSGGGKTTVVNALMGFLRPSEGEVRLPERDTIAFVGQEPGMISGTIADNVALGDPSADPGRIADALRRSGAPDLDTSRLGRRVAHLAADEERPRALPIGPVGEAGDRGHEHARADQERAGGQHHVETRNGEDMGKPGLP